MTQFDWEGLLLLIMAGIGFAFIGALWFGFVMVTNVVTSFLFGYPLCP